MMRATAQRRRILSYEEKDINIHPVQAKAGVKVKGCFPLIVAERLVGEVDVCVHD